MIWEPETVPYLAGSGSGRNVRNARAEVTPLPIVLIPGLNCTAAAFTPMLPTLWASAPVMVARHLVGDGIAGMARAILRDAPPRFALLGFSLGGYIAFEIMRQAPERVGRLCLLDTSARPDSPEATQKRRERMALAQAGRFAETADAAYALSVHPDHAGRADLRALCAEMALANGSEAFVRQQEAIIGRVDSRPTLARISVPTTVIVGDMDAITPPEQAREMAEGIAGAQLVQIATAGHMAVIEQPDAVTDAVAGWARA